MARLQPKSEKCFNLPAMRIQIIRVALCSRNPPILRDMLNSTLCEKVGTAYEEQLRVEGRRKCQDVRGAVKVSKAS